MFRPGHPHRYLPDIAHAGALAGFLSYRHIRLFDYAQWAEPLRDELRHNAEHLAAEAGLEIEFIRRLKAFRKEERIKAIIAERVFKLAALRKNIYSLHDLQNLLHAANDRYLSFMACIDNPDAEHKAIDKMTGPAKVNGRSFRGFNLFLDPDYRLFLTLCRGEWSISGFHTWWRMLTDSDETL